MVEEAQKIITTIRQMEASLDDSKPRRDYQSDDEDLKITYPLTRCLQVLKEKHIQISRLHKERFEQVKSSSALIRRGKNIMLIAKTQNLYRPLSPTRLIWSPRS